MYMYLSIQMWLKENSLNKIIITQKAKTSRQMKNFLFSPGKRQKFNKLALEKCLCILKSFPTQLKAKTIVPIRKTQNDTESTATKTVLANRTVQSIAKTFTHTHTHTGTNVSTNKKEQQRDEEGRKIK